MEELTRKIFGSCDLPWYLLWIVFGLFSGVGMIVVIDGGKWWNKLVSMFRRTVDDVSEYDVYCESLPSGVEAPTVEEWRQMGRPRSGK